MIYPSATCVSAPPRKPRAFNPTFHLALAGYIGIPVVSRLPAAAAVNLESVASPTRDNVFPRTALCMCVCDRVAPLLYCFSPSINPFPRCTRQLSIVLYRVSVCVCWCTSAVLSRTSLQGTRVFLPLLLLLYMASKDLFCVFDKVYSEFSISIAQEILR